MRYGIGALVFVVVAAGVFTIREAGASKPFLAQFKAVVCQVRHEGPRHADLQRSGWTRRAVRSATTRELDQDIQCLWQRVEKTGPADATHRTRRNSRLRWRKSPRSTRIPPIRRRRPTAIGCARANCPSAKSTSIRKPRGIKASWMQRNSLASHRPASRRPTHSSCPGRWRRPSPTGPARTLGPRRSSRPAGRSNFSRRKRSSIFKSVRGCTRCRQSRSIRTCRRTNCRSTWPRPPATSRGFRERFLLTLGGEHLLTYGVVTRSGGTIRPR